MLKLAETNQLAFWTHKGRQPERPLRHLRRSAKIPRGAELRHVKRFKPAVVTKPWLTKSSSHARVSVG
jgi:hypothetical protein